MAILDRRTEEISCVELDLLVEGKVPEGLRVEYKRQAYGKADADKREFLKDISGLANASGGHLLIGVEELDGCAHRLVGIDRSSADEEIRRIEGVVRSSIEPRIVGLELIAVPIDDVSVVIVIRVPKTWNGPHRVVFGGLNKFYVRTSGSTQEATLEELRTMFTQSAATLERAMAFRDERLELIRLGQTWRPLDGDGRLVVHVVPAAAFAGYVALDLEVARSNQTLLRPIDPDYPGFSPRYNFDGFVNAAGSDTVTSYTQVFRNGCIEAVLSAITWPRDQQVLVSARRVESALVFGTWSCLLGLKALEVPSPYLLLVSMMGVEGAFYSTEQGPWSRPTQPIVGASLHLPPVLLDEIRDELAFQKALRPAIDALWNSAGYAKAGWYSADGAWKSPGR